MIASKWRAGCVLRYRDTIERGWSEKTERKRMRAGLDQAAPAA